MALRSNRPLRNLGIYLFQGKKLILLKRSEQLSFLFSERNWVYRGPVEYRISHGDIYQRGELTIWTDEDLWDTGISALPRLAGAV